MTNQPKEFTLRGYLDSIRRQWWIVLIVAVIGAGVGYGYSKLQSPKYKATATLTINDPNQSLAIFGGNVVSGRTPLQEASAAAPLVTRPEVVTAVQDKLGKSVGAGDVSVSIDPNSYVVNVNASGSSPTKAAEIANTFADIDTALTTAEVRNQYSQQATAIAQQAKKNRHIPPALALAEVETYSRLQSLSRVANPIAITTRAQKPGGGSSTHGLRDGVIGLLVGLLIGLVLATARDALDRRLRHTGDVGEVLDHPVIGYVPSTALDRGGSSNGATQLTGPDQESFRILRENVAYLGVSPKSVVLVTSAGPQEGKSTVATRLAVATAEAGKRTLLIECDLRKPVLAERLGIQRAPGLTDYLTGNAEPHDILQPVGVAQPLNGSGPTHGGEHASASHLVCISSGKAASRPAELLASKRFQELLAEVSEVYDTVILDTAPLLSVADTLAIVPAASILLLCVRLRRTTRDQAQAARAALDRLPQRPVGVVLTDVHQRTDGYYDFYSTSASPIAPAASA